MLMKETLISPWPYYDNEQIDASSKVLRSGRVNFWTGEECKKFEKEFAQWSGVKHAIAVANGTLALEASYKSIGLGPGDEFITTPRTFIATSSSGVLLGAKPIFADVDQDSGAITAQNIEKLITSKTKAISVVHLGGWPADMPSICELASQYQLKVIEDCAQAHGAAIKVKNKFYSVGSFGDISTWSFCQDKIISTAGEGGMITTKHADTWEGLLAYKDHGKSFKKISQNQKHTGFRWIHDNIGSNLRLTEFQSAIGRIQLRKLSTWNKIRRRNALIMANALKDIPSVRVPMPSKDLKHAWYKFYAFIKEENLANGWGREKIMSLINNYGYPIFTGSCSEVYLEKCFKKNNFYQKNRLPIAKKLGETSLMFLIHPTISEEEMIRYSSCVRDVLNKASN